MLEGELRAEEGLWSMEEQKGGKEVGEKGCVVCFPDACVGWAWEGQWLEGWMQEYGVWGECNGCLPCPGENGVETLGSVVLESCKLMLG